MLFLMTVQDTVQRDKIIYIYQSQYSRMAYTVSKYLHSREDIEDAVQDTLERLIRIIDRIDIDDPVRLKNLCCVVARNVAINRARQHKNKLLPLDEVFNTEDRAEPTPEDRVIENDLMSRLISAIDSMSDIYRDVCRLKYINELKENEIAKLLDLPPKTVNQRIFRGRQMLKNILMKESINA
ncbi:MAG: sigma-70 family RNA polymerase sigma factor [Clostridia bacterium]|nr:sigma-70 family RNA polymerase sigma factor [Clostridia bacterium]